MNVAQVPADFSNDFWPSFDRGESGHIFRPHVDESAAADSKSAVRRGGLPYEVRGNYKKCVFPGRGHKGTDLCGVGGENFEWHLRRAMGVEIEHVGIVGGARSDSAGGAAG